VTVAAATPLMNVPRWTFLGAPIVSTGSMSSSLLWDVS